ncbi:regulation of nuclear pre-mRNA domain-containing protein 2-like isoform X2 [Stegodyphus dumicola]|uniref:regulation of nuclear pre-mRNA domain-containing protein 2-like isoform X2 n=1 Tax=Stegodyphus dumicola TaxID=202533 RepID=UPI0015A7BA00|nr:regulation of nuclear pre-mRNA domain-containing protein 2-like isoform X2 [Stegodyphus dumicola]
MFYVANDVIQHCGKKKAPEFREAFSTVLEKAVCLQKVKEIKSEVNRMLTLWNEREIYDKEFFKRLETKLNCTEDENAAEEELEESKIISNFKLQNLIDALQKLKTLENEINEKEAMLDDLEEPKMPDLENIIVHMDSQNVLQKFDIYKNAFEEYIQLAVRGIAARKTFLRELKNSSVFYSVQNEEVKKVAHAYRIYGKKLKIIEKRLSEKMHFLGTLNEYSSNSPNFSAELKELTKSPDQASENNEKSNTSENVAELLPSPCREQDTVAKDGSNLFSKDNSSLEKTSIKRTPNYIECSNESMQSNDMEVSNRNDAEESVTVNSSDAGASEEISDNADLNEIDFLLEKAYDNQQSKRKTNFKRKIESLLKATGKKTCNMPTENTDNKSHEIDSRASVHVIEEANISQTVKESSSDVKNGTSVIAKCSIDNEEMLVNNTKIKNDLETETHFPNELNFVNLQRSNSVADESSKKVTDKNEVSQENLKKVNSPIVSSISSMLSDTSTVISSNTSINPDVSSYMPVSTIPDIPTELLKSILNKSKVNLLQDSKNDNCHTNSMTTSAESGSILPQNSLESSSYSVSEAESSFSHTNVECTSSIADDKNKSSASTSFEVKEYLNKREIPASLHKPDEIISDAIKGDSLSLADAIKNCSSAAQKTDHDVYYTSDRNAVNLGETLENSAVCNDNVPKSDYKVRPKFLGNLKSALECITRNKSFTNSSEFESQKTLLPIPFEHTLKLYNCLLQCNNLSYSINTSNNNKTEDSSRGILPFNSSINIKNSDRSNLIQTSAKIKSETNTTDCNLNSEVIKSYISASPHPTVLNNFYEKEEACTSNSYMKDDNLEIMDMDVDSDDENP